MPTKRVRIPRRPIGAVLSPAVWAVLRDLEPGSRTDPAVIGIEYFGDPASWGELWRVHGPEAVRQHAAARPGSRPALWWLHDAPEPERRRLGGKGEVWPALRPDPARRLNLDHGLPYGPWVSGTVDPLDLPCYESTAAYLDRNGLWLPGERRRAPPEAWEAITAWQEDDDHSAEWP